MIPLRDDNPTRSFPIITIALIVINVIVFVVQKLTPGFDNIYSMVPREITLGHGLSGIAVFGDHGAVLRPFPIVNGGYALPRPFPPNAVILLQPPHPVWLTIFTSMFMHASLWHIGGNMLFLWIFGNNIEDALGKVKFVLFYLVCGVAAAFAQIAADPSSLVPTLGASGAIAGVLGAYLIIYPNARVLTVFILGFLFLREISAYWVIGIWIVLQIIPGVANLGGTTMGGVAYFAHIGGFTAGIVLILLLGGRGLAVQQRQAARNY